MACQAGARDRRAPGDGAAHPAHHLRIPVQKQKADHAGPGQAARDQRAAIRKLPQGTWRSSMTLDGYESPIELQAALTVKDGRIQSGHLIASSGFGAGLSILARTHGRALMSAPLRPRRPRGGKQSEQDEEHQATRHE